MIDRQRNADRFYLAGKVGATAFVLQTVLFVFVNYLLLGLPEAFHAPGMLGRNILNLVALVALAWAFITLILRRKSDEFTLATWHAATTSGFFASVIILFFAPVLISGLEQLSGSGERVDTELLMAWGSLFVIAAFFVGFHMKLPRS